MNLEKSFLARSKDYKIRRKTHHADVPGKLNPFILLAKKQLGQNFLIDPNIAEKIVSECRLKPNDIVLEIGSGLGALTGKIAQQVTQLIAMETDQRLYQELKNTVRQDHIHVIHADFLKYDLNSLPKNIKAIGNLPYYISSAIIARVLEYRHQFNSLYITVQYEFGKRIVAKVHTKDYGAFSCLVQYYCDAHMLFRIKNTCFYPAPKVESCFMELKVKPQPEHKAMDESFLFQLIRQAFQHRRKTILNSLSSLVDKKELQGTLEVLKIDSRSRAENLSLKEYVALGNFLKSS